MPTSILPWTGRGDRVGDATMDIGLLALLAVGGYFLFKNIGSLFSSTGSQAIAANNQAVSSSTTQANAATQQQVAATGQQPTISPATINTLSTTVVSAINSTGDYPDPTAGSMILNAVDQVNNTADWVALASTFGTKQLQNGQSVDLLTAMSIVMTGDQKNNIDQFFVAQGIKSTAGQILMVP